MMIKVLETAVFVAIALVILTGCSVLEKGVTADTGTYLLIRRADVEASAGPVTRLSPVTGAGEALGVYEGPDGQPKGVCVSYSAQRTTAGSVETVTVTTIECFGE